MIIIRQHSTNDTLPRPQAYKGSDTYSYEEDTDKLSEVDTPSITFNYTHDANGNILTDGQRYFTWNQDNRLSSVDSGGDNTTFVYNGKGQRIKKTTSTGSVTIYHYDLAGNLIEETDENGNMIADYVYAGTERVAMVKPDAGVYYYHNDHLGGPACHDRQPDRAGSVGSRLPAIW